MTAVSNSPIEGLQRIVEAADRFAGVVVDRRVGGRHKAVDDPPGLSYVLASSIEKRARCVAIDFFRLSPAYRLWSHREVTSFG
jgi:hypothetical protein